MSGTLTAYQTAIHMSVDLFLHSSEPKSSFHHVDCSPDTLMTSAVMKNLDDAGYQALWYYIDSTNVP